MLLKISSKLCHLRKNPKNSVFEDFNVNSFIFQTVTNKTDFTPTYFKLNSPEFFSLAFNILILFCSLALQVVSIGTNLTLKMYKPWVQKNHRK